MQKLALESGKSFDPKVVDVLLKRYENLERIVISKSAEDLNAPLSTAIKIDRGLEPAAGFENSTATDYVGRETTFLSSIAAARQEAQALFELSQDLGASLSLGETLSVFSVKLKPMVPYDAIAIYIKREEELVAEFVNGDNYRLFSSLRIPMGQGLSGWVAHNRKPIINGNPSVEPGYLNDPSKFSTLRSALEEAGLKIKPGNHPILPVMLGDAALASRMADMLLERDIYVIGFSFPVVPQGQARIRIQVSAAHTQEQLDKEARAFASVAKELALA